LMRSRKPLPSELRVLDGNPGKRPISSSGSRGPIGVAPLDLNEAALLKWAELCEKSAWGLVLTEGDRDVLAEYCRLHARKQKAEQKIEEHGELVASPNGFPVQSPWV
ncbi:MAG: P27 family phage terminase small subunit, partial [Beijerinckiaceae bacterium]